MLLRPARAGAAVEACEVCRISLPHPDEIREGSFPVRLPMVLARAAQAGLDQYRKILEVSHSVRLEALRLHGLRDRGLAQVLEKRPGGLRFLAGPATPAARLT